ncbi:unnamed protein product [Lupinus luteus]|uniref:Uncharacterized protein n=1 Tax=Lupinus luteus TaxID=3873 RepID=A0AAV1X528_LUPLU
MGQHVRRDSYPSATSSRLEYLHHQGSRRLDVLVVEADDLPWPFQKIVSFDDNEVRETAYEIFFTSCRSSPGFGGRHALTFHSSHENIGGNGDGGGKLNQVVTKPTSRVKKALGLKLLKRSPSKRMLSGIGSGGYIVTGQVEPDLLCASHAMLNEVANDAKKEKDSLYIKILSSVLTSMQGWAEKRLLNYHEYFQRGNANQIENLLSLVLTASKILGEDLTITDGEGGQKGGITIVDSSGDRVDNYIRSSMKNAFEKTWNPKSKSEQFAPSAAELMKLAAATVEECFQVPIAITEDLVQVLADGLEILFQDYIMFVAACGSKQSYIPVLPSLTRCNPDSKLIKLWKKAAPCTSGCEQQHCTKVIHEAHHHHHKQSTSRGTQRLYVRLNTLHYLHTHIHSLDKALYLNPGVVPSNRIRFAKNRRDQSSTSSYFESANLCIQAACQHVSEVAAYRLVFHDSRSVFYDSLYVGGVARGQIKPVLRILNHNISLLTTILTDRAQSLTLKEVMKAAFNSFLMVLLAGGSSRLFVRPDHEIIREDFEHLRRVFSNCVEGLIADNGVEGETALVEGVIALMSRSTEQLMEDFSVVTSEGSGIGILGNRQNLPMPPTTGKWNRSDPNTILRVLCYRNDRAANQFLKKTFQLAKRR